MTVSTVPSRIQSNGGDGLAYLREAAGVTLDQISDSTKISKTFLSAIEDGRFDELPGGVFTRSYIRQYAAAIGCDPDPILRSLEPPPPAAPPERKTAQRDTPSLLVRFFSIG